jgi:hypothetical protein
VNITQRPWATFFELSHLAGGQRDIENDEVPARLFQIEADRERGLPRGANLTASSSVFGRSGLRDSISFAHPRCKGCRRWRAIPGGGALSSPRICRFAAVFHAEHEPRGVSGSAGRTHGSTAAFRTPAAMRCISQRMDHRPNGVLEKYYPIGREPRDIRFGQRLFRTRVLRSGFQCAKPLHQDRTALLQADASREEFKAGASREAGATQKERSERVSTAR